MKNVKQYTKDVLDSITDLISSKNNINNMILDRDFNEDIEINEIEIFVILNRLKDAFWHVNKEDGERIEKITREAKHMSILFQ